uniref:Uncharacterized protein n=1 Tax=Psilocybe cubensis TaxID=181762 RepID=A0A8H8CJJ2_PSICU
MVDSGLQWYSIFWGIVPTGDTREDIFWGVQDAPEGVFLPNGFLFKFMVVVSDCLLIWRCYHVWGKSFWAISVSAAFLIIEFALCVLATVSEGGDNVLCDFYTYFVGALNLTSLATTITATSMIAFKIHSASRMKGSPSRTLFNHVVIVMVESAAPYSIFLLLEALASFIPTFNNLGTPANDFYGYLDTVMTFVAGMAPTVLVARVALKSSENLSAQRISNQQRNFSDLQFGSQQRDRSESSMCNTGIYVHR